MQFRLGRAAVDAVANSALGVGRVVGEVVVVGGGGPFGPLSHLREVVRIGARTELSAPYVRFGVGDGRYECVAVEDLLLLPGTGVVSAVLVVEAHEVAPTEQQILPQVLVLDAHDRVAQAAQAQELSLVEQLIPVVVSVPLHVAVHFGLGPGVRDRLRRVVQAVAVGLELGLRLLEQRSILLIGGLVSLVLTVGAVEFDPEHLMG